MGEFMKFEMLADSIKEINVKAGNIAKCAVNQLMTLRNWAIGIILLNMNKGEVTGHRMAHGYLKI